MEPFDLYSSTSSKELTLGNEISNSESTSDAELINTTLDSNWNEEIDLNFFSDNCLNSSLLGSNDDNLHTESTIMKSAASRSEDRNKRKKFKVPYKWAKKSVCDLENCTFCSVKSNCGQCPFCVNKERSG